MADGFDFSRYILPAFKDDWASHAAKQDFARDAATDGDTDTVFPQPGVRPSSPRVAYFYSSASSLSDALELWAREGVSGLKGSPKRLATAGVAESIPNLQRQFAEARRAFFDRVKEGAAAPLQEEAAALLSELGEALQHAHAILLREERPIRSRAAASICSVMDATAPILTKVQAVIEEWKPLVERWLPGGPPHPDPRTRVALRLHLEVMPLSVAFLDPARFFREFAPRLSSEFWPRVADGNARNIEERLVLTLWTWGYGVLLNPAVHESLSHAPAGVLARVLARAEGRSMPVAPDGRPARVSREEVQELYGWNAEYAADQHPRERKPVRGKATPVGGQNPLRAPSVRSAALKNTATDTGLSVRQVRRRVPGRPRKPPAKR